jgi:hypothetical protein
MATIRLSQVMDWAGDDDMALKIPEKTFNLKRMMALGHGFCISGGSGEFSQPTPETVNALMSPRKAAIAPLFAQE